MIGQCHPTLCHTNATPFMLARLKFKIVTPTLEYVGYTKYQIEYHNVEQHKYNNLCQTLKVLKMFLKHQLIKVKNSKNMLELV